VKQTSPLNLNDSYSINDSYPIPTRIALAGSPSSIAITMVDKIPL
jgi:hypothetical protein